MKKTILKISAGTVAAGLCVYAVFASMGISGIQAGSALVFLGLTAFVFAGGVGNMIHFDDDAGFLARAVVFFLAWSFVASAAGGAALAGLRNLAPLVGAFSIFCGLAASSPRARAAYLSVALMFFAVQSVYGIAQYFTGIDITRGGFSEPYLRVRGTLGYFNSLGGVLGMMLPVAAGFAVFPSDKKKKLPYAVAAVLMAGALLATFTRGAWIGAAAGVAVVFFLRYGRRAFFIFALLPAMLFLAPVRSRLADIKSRPETERVYMWRKSAAMIKTSPVLGFGAGGFERAAARDAAAGIIQKHFHPHNIFMAAALDGGIPLALALAAFLFVMFRRAAKTFVLARASSSGGASVMPAALAAGVLGSLTDFAAHGMVDNLFSGETLYLLWFLAGCLFFYEK
ncbi:MAG: hypothetical protein CVU77_02955 [Elusimicrobia bacterium HGW-Elusimicrobia-1]|nr:MAG: hypothetical protein CVU77_02955 [Elusimicrobia bacterium HGW-Elusimicrobia-1]